MEEIKKGEYVRIDDGKILKFDRFGTYRVGFSNDKYIKTIISNKRGHKYKDIVAHSFNIIDLIQEGDYVNGHLVINLGKHGDLILDDGGYHSIFPVDIKSIVTKEQFKEIEYVL